MSYNPSIGRVLEKGGVTKFRNVVADFAPQLSRIQTQHTFDSFHESFVKEVLTTFKTARNTDLSYGQAQKPVNVFLKVYVDWAGKPSVETRARLLPWLHVPLDSILMKTIKEHFSDWYRDEIKLSVTELSLSKIDKTLYTKWQTFFRSQYPQKPLIFDVAWAMNRK